MASFKLVVLSNPVAGRDAEYNDWYTHVHLRDITAIPGFLSAQRFRMRNPVGFDHPWKYLAIYEMESDDPDGVVEKMLSLQGSDAMVISEALDIDGALAGVFEPITALVPEAV